jgi:phytoene synthase
MAGELRLQWWRDAILNMEPAGHPVAEALVTAIRDASLPPVAFDRLLTARVFDLYDDAIGPMGELEGYLGDTSSSLIQLAAIVLVDGKDPGTANAAGHAGVAYGLTGLMRALPVTASRRQLFLPADILARHGAEPEAIFAGEATAGVKAALAELIAAARDHLAKAQLALAGADPRVLPAFLPVALAETYLDLMARPDFDPFRTPAEVPQWRRQWRLLHAARAGRI